MRHSTPITKYMANDVYLTLSTLFNSFPWWRSTADICLLPDGTKLLPDPIFLTWDLWALPVLLSYIKLYITWARYDGENDLLEIQFNHIWASARDSELWQRFTLLWHDGDTASKISWPIAIWGQITIYRNMTIVLNSGHTVEVRICIWLRVNKGKLCNIITIRFEQIDRLYVDNTPISQDDNTRTLLKIP